jgi:hypothetical protein
MSKTLEEFSASALATVIESNLIERFRLIFVHLPQIEVHDDPDMVWATTNIPHPYLNCVLHAKLAPDEMDGRIETTIAHFRSR